MKQTEFDFKGKLQKIIADSMKDPAYASKMINIFSLYANLYVRPHLDEVVRNLAVDYDEVVEKLVPKQLEIFDAMINDHFVAVFGSRKTGKTYLMALAIILLGTDRKMQVHILSSKKDTAAHVIIMMTWIAEEYGLDIFKRVSAEKCTFWNGTQVKIHANTLADTGTYEADILILDEAQEIDENVWGKIMPQLATGRDMYIWIMGTAKAGTMFHTFWFENKKFKKFMMHMSDATWVSAEQWQDIMDVMPERMVRQELLLKWVEAEGAYFSSKDVSRAFEDYEIEALKKYGEIVVTIDWGWGHECVMFVIAIKDGVIYELESWGMQNAPREKIMRMFDEYKRKYSPYFILEGGQTVASWVGDELHKKNYDFGYSIFGKSKELFWEAMDFVLDSGKLKLDNYRLKQQLLKYCGDKKEDDYVDSLMHGVYYYVYKYLQDELEDWCYGSNN